MTDLSGKHHSEQEMKQKLNFQQRKKMKVNDKKALTNAQLIL